MTKLEVGEREAIYLLPDYLPFREDSLENIRWETLLAQMELHPGKQAILLPSFTMTLGTTLLEISMLPISEEILAKRSCAFHAATISGVNRKKDSRHDCSRAHVSVYQNTHPNPMIVAMIRSWRGESRTRD